MRKLGLLFYCIIYLMFLVSCASSNVEPPVIVFHNTVCIKPHEGYHYQTCHPITVTIDDFIMIVPADFDTDLASIPRWLWSIIAPSRSDFIPASILHDYLYTCHNGYGRKEIDTIFYTALRENGVSTMRAYQMYLAVRLFGQGHYSEDGSCAERLYKIAKRYGRCKDDIDSNIS